MHLLFPRVCECVRPSRVLQREVLRGLLSLLEGTVRVKRVFSQSRLSRGLRDLLLSRWKRRSSRRKDPLTPLLTIFEAVPLLASPLLLARILVDPLRETSARKPLLLEWR